MWTGIIVIVVVGGLFLVARVVMSGSIGRLRFGTNQRTATAMATVRVPDQATAQEAPSPSPAKVRQLS